MVQVLDGEFDLPFPSSEISAVVTQISLTAPRVQMKRLRAWIKASDSKEPTSSMWMALNVKHTKMHP